VRHTIKKLHLTLGVLLTLFACGDVVEVTPELREAADGYLTLLDRGQNEEVWHQSAIIFKESVTLDAWLKQVEQLKTECREMQLGSKIQRITPRVNM